MADESRAANQNQKAPSARFTPGPWKLSDGWVVSDAGGRHFQIARIAEARLADAKLIAAAPQLMDALEAMLLNARSHKDCPRSLPSLPIAQAEAALRAAGRLP